MRSINEIDIFFALSLWLSHKGAPLPWQASWKMRFTFFQAEEEETHTDTNAAEINQFDTIQWDCRKRFQRCC